LGDISGGQGTGGDLVKERLEQMMVGAVNEGDADIGMMKLFAERQAAEACAEHDDMWLFASCHADNVMQTGQKATVKTQTESIRRLWQYRGSPGAISIPGPRSHRACPEG